MIENRSTNIGTDALPQPRNHIKTDVGTQRYNHPKCAGKTDHGEQRVFRLSRHALVYDHFQTLPQAQGRRGGQ